VISELQTKAQSREQQFTKKIRELENDCTIQEVSRPEVWGFATSPSLLPNACILRSKIHNEITLQKYAN